MTTKNIKIYCKNTGIEKEYPIGTPLKSIMDDQNISLKMPVLGARVNNKIKELDYCVFKPKVIDFFDFTNIDGQRMYRRSLCFILIKAAKKIIPQCHVIIDNSISDGLYCRLEQNSEDYIPTDKEVDGLKAEMQQIIDKKLPFIRKEILSSNAAELFASMGMDDKTDLFKNRKRIFSSVYYLDNQADYFYGYLVPDTGYITKFDLIKYYNGMLLRYPVDTPNFNIPTLKKQEKLFEVFCEESRWYKLLGFSNVASLNKIAKNNKATDLIKISEALHEKKLAQIAEQIKSTGNIKLVLIAGPSSSGKTTTSKRLCVQLSVAGLKPVQISLDNYFVNRVDTPKDENGEYDFECLEALDYKQFNEDMINLMDGKTVEMPIYSFEKGERIYKGDFITATPDTVFVVEGIHGLNPQLSSMIPENRKFKIYVSALTQLNIDNHNRIPTTDNRLLRRIIRDYQYRHYSAEETIKRWPGVRKGEDKNIFPYQEEADIMFNSALPYELGVIKKYVEPVLSSVSETSPEYSEAQRLLKFLTYFNEIPVNEIPPTSILREFLSGSSFQY